ncbi:helix-turn-helix domain-containing protein [Kribbella capetownensis]|uniref:Helix-turn-helix domain-containing protein n=2 Tax=Kribbella capetownensis TaxID=1572659 RepID=A0A4R0JIM4_9ACTN|nr:helix-turn-helix domain-containing protein [Kribbella capetownensis]
MPRKPLELGSWGKIRTYVDHVDKKGKADSYRSVAYFRDFDGTTRQVEANGKTKTAAENNLQNKLKERAQLARSGMLTSMTRISAAADVYFAKLESMVKDGKRSPGTLYTYQQQFKTNLLSRIGEVRLGEATTPLLDKVITAIKDEVGGVSAKTCKSVLSGILSLAVRHGAIRSNPVRELESIEAAPKKAPRALTAHEREAWFAMVSKDERAVRADIPDLSLFLLATGVRIAESLAVLWADVDLDSKEVAITSQINRVPGQGLVRRRTKSRAGNRVLSLPSWAIAMLERRFSVGIRLDSPVFPDALAGFRDPNNVRQDLRLARQPIGSQLRRELGQELRKARREAGMTQTEAARRLGWSKNRVSLVETARVRVDPSEAKRLLDLYRTPRTVRGSVLDLVARACEPSVADELAWVTSHVFRKTTATVLDEAGQTARQVADQLGQSRPSMTQDVYFGRKARNPEAAQALDKVMPGASEAETHGVNHGPEVSGS